MSTSAVSLLSTQLKAAHDFLEGTMQGVTAEQARWTPPGLANPLGATYAHIALSEDGIINGMLKGGAPLFVTDWEGKVGLQNLPPMPSPGGSGLSSWSDWARQAEVDLPALQQYAQAVYANTEAYLTSLSDEDLSRPVDLSALGLGQHTVASLLSTALSNIQWHCGEIACLKGLQGVKGYPV
ncbi:MAG: DinB family protein [Anaerolineales bacterium]|nr:DinB family protein [Anaerolineales bacterium]